MRFARVKVLTLAVAFAAASLASAAAQKQEPPGAQPPPSVSETGVPALPDAETMVGLVRTALLTLNDAVRTGNFTVLRDVAAPGFREAHTAAGLSAIFASLIKDRVDLSSVATAVPKLSETPAIDPGTGLLTIKGEFSTKDGSVKFGLAFQSLDERWVLFGILVQPIAALVFSAPPDAAKAFLEKTPASSGAR